MNLKCLSCYDGTLNCCDTCTDVEKAYRYNYNLKSCKLFTRSYLIAFTNDKNERLVFPSKFI